MGLTADLCSIGFNDQYAKLIGNAVDLRALLSSFTWTDWTPTLTQGATVSKTVNRAKYVKIGNVIVAFCYLSPTAAGTASNAITVSVPLTPAADPCGAGAYWYYDLGTTIHAGTAIVGAAASFYQEGDGNPLGVSAPTIASGDGFQMIVIYEAA